MTYLFLLMGMVSGALLLSAFLNVWEAYHDMQARERARREYRDRAYIVGTLDLESTPPRLVMVGAYSCRAEQLTVQIGRYFHFDIDSVEAEDFHRARERAEQKLREFPHLGWALKLYNNPWPEP